MPQRLELLLFLALREIQMRYKQSVLSFLWALARPIALIVVFTYLFGTVAGMDSGDIPYQSSSFRASCALSYSPAS